MEIDLVNKKKTKNNKQKEIPLSSPKITNYTVINFNDGQNKLHINAMMMMYVLWLTNTFSGFFIVLAHWNNIPRIDLSLHSHTLSWFRANKYLLLLRNATC